MRPTSQLSPCVAGTRPPEQNRLKPPKVTLSPAVETGKAALKTMYTMANLSVTRAARLHGIHCPQMQIFSARDKVKGPLGPRQANDGSQR